MQQSLNNSHNRPHFSLLKCSIHISYMIKPKNRYQQSLTLLLFWKYKGIKKIVSCGSWSSNKASAMRDEQELDSQKY